jgi:hypothetical protein
MCSKYAAPDGQSLDPKQARFFYNSTFTTAALQQRGGGSDAEACVGPALSSAQRSVFLDFLHSGLLQEARVQGRCGSCWAYAISAVVQYATALAYQRLGGWFNNRYMAPQLLLSCIEAEGVACGCFGGDLAAGMALVAEEGMVTFRQFPYENDSSVATQEGQVHYLCRPNEGAKGYLGTCAPCRKEEPDLETVLPTRMETGGFSAPIEVLSSCMPCDSIGAPFYFPLSPCRLYRDDESVEANVEAVKRSLCAHGPLCATIRVNTADLEAVGKFGGVLADVTTAPIYKPQSTPPTGALHSIAVVGYVDPWAGAPTPQNRARAVFVCRNSWGPDWGFKIKTRSIEQAADGSQTMAESVLGGFFLVSMYEGVDVTGLLQTTVGLRGMQIRTLGDAAPRPLRLTDPFVVPLKGSLPTLLSGASWTRRGPLPGEGAFWRTLLVACLIVSLLLATFIYFIFWRE